MQNLLPDWVAYHARRRGEAPAVTSLERGVTLSWTALEARVARLAHVLRHQLGLPAGERVGLIAENDTRVFELQFACMRAGLVLVPFNWRLTLHENTGLARDAAPGLMVYDETWRGPGEAIAAALGIEHCLCWSDSDGGSYEAAISASGGAMPAGWYEADAVTHILYTSGTTGLPKGVLCSQGSLRQHAIHVAFTSRMAEAGGHHFNAVPLFHAGGLNTFTNPTLFWGGHVSTVRRFDPATTLALLTDPDRAITHFCAVQQMIDLMTALPAFASARFPTIRAALFGGWGPKAVRVHQQWRARGCFLQLSYGSTEQGPLVTVLGEGDALADQNCAGQPVPGTRLRLVNSAGQDVASGEVGEIWTSGAAITPGYWRRPRADFFEGDWFRTGDCGRLDAMGRLYVVDRLREVFRSGGENIFPAEIERVLIDAPGVAEIAVIGVEDARWGEVGLAIVEPRPGADVTLETLTGFAEGKLARFKWPKRLAIVQTMPRNATLKIDRPALRKRLLS